MTPDDKDRLDGVIRRPSRLDAATVNLSQVLASQRHTEDALGPEAILGTDDPPTGHAQEAGHPVVPVKPNAIKAWRDGEVLSGAKSDAEDAAVIAEYLRLRYHRLAPAVPCPGETQGAAHRGPHPR